MRTRFVTLGMLCALLVAAPAAWASSLDEAKTAGWVGERVDGYVGLVRSDAPESARQLVTEVNQQRRAHYEEIAAKRGVGAAEVAKAAGAKLVDRAGRGEFVRDATGRWIQKP